jgi:hypothetical protein
MYDTFGRDLKRRSSGAVLPTAIVRSCSRSEALVGESHRPDWTEAPDAQSRGSWYFRATSTVGGVGLATCARARVSCWLGKIR